MSKEGPAREADGIVGRRFGFGVVRRRMCGDVEDVDLCLADHDAVLSSWWPGISFRSVGPGPGDRGLRRAQLGALHAVLAHWSTGNDEPATVVLPTGTGKTETMLALLVEARIRRLLVVVPSDALRTQLAGKFETLGLLGALGVLPDGAQLPSVGVLTGRPTDVDEMQTFIEASQVVISTPNALASAPDEVKAALFGACGTLFFDEAHHVRASTWTEIRDAFTGKKVVQFTATPFREDGQHLQGRFIYVFPLREAQADGVYSRINYESVFELIDPDAAIATRASAVLDQDLSNGLDHILMARCKSRADAERVHAMYRQVSSEHNPVVMHSGMAKSRLDAALKEVRARRSRIIVCVDMLGEGFDLPQLKIAALHDPKRSLAPTLQFAGRFARVAAGTGDATVVTGRSERLFDQRLSRLYGEDADWNLVIAELSHNAIFDQEKISQFEQEFGSQAVRIATRAVSPKMSTVVFRTTCEEWTPDGVLALFASEDILTLPLPINHADHVMWFVTRARQVVPWVEGPGIEDVAHSLFVLHWDKEQNLLFLNHSANEGAYTDIAKAVVGDAAQLIKGDQVFRAMGEMARPVPTNVGVLDIYSRARRFSMYVGANVTEGFPTAEEATKVQTNLFAAGFRDGERVTVGVSLKGRVWSYLVARNLLDWVKWCQGVGRRLLDESIDVQAVKRNFIRPVILNAWPDAVPLGAEWPTELLLSPPATLVVRIGDADVPLTEIELTVEPHLSEEGNVRVTLASEDESVQYDIVLDAEGMRARAMSREATFTTSRRSVPGSEFLTEHCPIVLLGGDGVVSPPGVLFRPNRDILALDRNELTPISWTGINLNRESRGKQKNSATVQGRSLEWLQTYEWDFLIDDDGKGEIADLVALRVEDGTLRVLLVHCKFAHGGTVGARLADLYELCGQAQKSAAWRRHPENMVRKLLARERRRVGQGKASGLETGTPSDLLRLLGDIPTLHVEMEIVLAQPGLSQRRASAEQLELLAATKTYVRETSSAQLRILTSD
jgi:superfamily II DNA or RNA helicase